ncbi:MAG: hypothetical protein CL920_15600 [Deltaproteobacteria bacterium]|nr:hypothetical protein [Deltaproteobacteria bacterium]|tara:strand:- start:286 stop:525 length:240 start_codon:yes stop_codon:yes gene_type:complete
MSYLSAQDMADSLWFHLSWRGTLVDFIIQSSKLHLLMQRSLKILSKRQSNFPSRVIEKSSWKSGEHSKDNILAKENPNE